MRQKRMRRAAGIGLAALAWIGPTSAGATTITHRFEGVVTEAEADAGLFGPAGTVDVGDTFTGHFSYEIGPANPDQLPESPEEGTYDLLSFGIDQSPLSFLNPTVYIIHRAYDEDLPDGDVLGINADIGDYSLPSLALEGPYGAAFTDDSLPTSLDLASFPETRFIATQFVPAPGLGHEMVHDVGALTSLRTVPEPATGLLLALAAGAALARGRRGRAVAWIPAEARPRERSA